MPTKKVDLEDSTLNTEVVVTLIAKPAGHPVLRLNRAIFHAQGGGRRPDQGTIGGIAVFAVQRAENGKVDHILSATFGFGVSDSIALTVDGAVRAVHAHPRFLPAGRAGTHVADRSTIEDRNPAHMETAARRTHQPQRGARARRMRPTEIAGGVPTVIASAIVTEEEKKMVTNKLYLSQDDLAVQAVVTAVIDGEQKVVRLDQTVFHAQGGGQRADRGTIAGVQVTDVRHVENGEVDHVVPDIGRIGVGDSVALAVDADARLLHARLHTAGHLIADAAQDMAPALTPKAGHHWPREARVEFTGSVDDLEKFKSSLQQRVDALVAGDVAVEIGGDPYATRAVKIGNGRPVSCGGTHVKSAGALGVVTIRKVQSKKGVVRVSYGVRGEL